MVWGSTRLSWAKESVFSVLTPGHCMSPVIHTRQDGPLKMVRVVRLPGVTHMAVQAIWGAWPRPPTTGVVGRALHTMHLLGWQLQEGWSCRGSWSPCTSCGIPSNGSRTECGRGYAAMQAMLRGLGDGADALCGEACWWGQYGRQCGCRTTACGTQQPARTAAPRMRTRPTSSGTALGGGGAALGALSGGGAAASKALEHWPACLRRAGLLLHSLSTGTDRALLDKFLHPLLHGMYLAVLAARMAMGRESRPGPGDALSPQEPCPGGVGVYPWQDLHGPLPCAPLALPPPPLAARLWEQAFAHDLVHWTGALVWRLGPGDVCWAELHWTAKPFLAVRCLRSRTTRLGAAGSCWGSGHKCCARLCDSCRG